MNALSNGTAEQDSALASLNQWALKSDFRDALDHAQDFIVGKYPEMEEAALGVISMYVVKHAVQHNKSVRVAALEMVLNNEEFDALYTARSYK